VPRVRWIVKSVRVYLPFVCLAARALLSTSPAVGLTMLAMFMLGAPLLSVDLALGSEVEVTVVVVAAVDCVGASEAVFEETGDRVSVLCEDLY